MIPSILIMLIAFYWLGRETDWLRVRLLAGSEYVWHDELPYEIGYSDNEIEDTAYWDWLAKRHEPELVYTPVANAIDPRDKWMVTEEDLTKRRNGEMIYQRGGARGYSQLNSKEREIVGL